MDLRGDLPWPPDSASSMYLGHVLEHLTEADCQHLLDRLLPILRPGGEILVVGPDCERAEAMARDGVLDVTMESLVHGGHRWPGDEHQWTSTPKPVMAMLERAGFVDVTDIGIRNVPAGWPVADRQPVWQFAIAARRASGQQP